MTKAAAAHCQAGFQERQADWPKDMAKYRELSDPEELQRVSGVHEGFWGATYRVASIWPYKLATGLLDKCFQLAIAGGGSFNLQTTTPVTSLNSYADSQHGVMTKRGTISTSKVALCTNGYISHLLPDMRNKVMPVRGTCSSLLPATTQLPNTPSSKVFRPLFTSFALKFGDTGEYMISRQEGRKEMILGGAKKVYKENLECWYGNVDDTALMWVSFVVNSELTSSPGAKEHFNTYMPTHFVNWPNETSNLDRVWTGSEY